MITFSRPSHGSLLVGAYLLDFIVILPFTGLSYWLSDTSRMTQLIFFIPGLVFGLWFHVYLVKLYGGTPGKLMLKIRIARLDGSAVGYREALNILRLVRRRRHLDDFIQRGYSRSHFCRPGNTQRFHAFAASHFADAGNIGGRGDVLAQFR